MAQGGKRPGAGRPQGSLSGHTLLAQEMRKQLIEAAEKEWKEIIAALIRNAKYGDTVAARELLDRIFGKATAQLELSGPGGLPFQIIVKQQDSGDNRS